MTPAGQPLEHRGGIPVVDGLAQDGPVDDDRRVRPEDDQVRTRTRRTPSA